MAFTTHGHYVPGLPQEERPANQVRARCGGPGMCVKCSVEAGNALRAHIAGHVENPNEEETGVGLTVQPAK